MKFLTLVLTLNLLTGCATTPGPEPASDTKQVSTTLVSTKCNQTLEKAVFDVCYTYGMKGPRFVAYRLSGKLVNKNNLTKRYSFRIDDTIPEAFRSKSSDYTNSGYDRGHLASDVSFDYDEASVKSTYVMSNVVPMVPVINRIVWYKAEKLERKLAVDFERVTVLNGVLYGNDPKRIGESGVAVPTKFWKMIVNISVGYHKCFIFDNTDDINTELDKLSDHLIDCGDEVLWE